MSYDEFSASTSMGQSKDNGVFSESGRDLANRFGGFAAILGLVAFGLRGCFAPLPLMTGAGYLVGLVMDLPSMKS